MPRSWKKIDALQYEKMDKIQEQDKAEYGDGRIDLDRAFWKAFEFKHFQQTGKWPDECTKECALCTEQREKTKSKTREIETLQVLNVTLEIGDSRVQFVMLTESPHKVTEIERMIENHMSDFIKVNMTYEQIKTISM